MFEISNNFIGGNIEVISTDGNKAVLKRELRDTSEEWFYWAFCVRGAAGNTITFYICDNYIGPFGPAVSHDNKSWSWLGKCDSEHSFTYTFSENEDCVYFAHSMLYHPDRFIEFCADRGVWVKSIGKSKNGDDIPYITFGSGDKYIVLTARHHACESPGSYVLEGVLDGLLKNPVNNLSVICVPFVDYDGVCAGDQGKSRIPHDHNRDYVIDEEPIYDTVRFIRDFAKVHHIKYAFDFHAPCHRYEINDTVFMVQKNVRQLKEMDKFGEILERNNAKNTLKYYAKDKAVPNNGWNSSDLPCFGTYMGRMTESVIAFSLETCYFGTEKSQFTESGALTLGRNFAKSINDFDRA